MTPSIAIERVWADDHCAEFEISALDGCSQFCAKVYAEHEQRVLYPSSNSNAKR
jgi:hypothetical protein